MLCGLEVVPVAQRLVGGPRRTVLTDSLCDYAPRMWAICENVLSSSSTADSQVDDDSWQVRWCFANDNSTNRMQTRKTCYKSAMSCIREMCVWCPHEVMPLQPLV